MPHQSTHRTPSYQIQLKPEMRADLEDLAQRRGCPASQLVRMAIKALIEMEVNDTPHCSNGTRCLCPHMWARPKKV